jgi:hypothetical protein
MNFCLPVLILYTIFGFALFIGLVIVPIVKLNKYELTNCNIDSINYPIKLPTRNDSTLWEICDCGRLCESLSPCLQIYVNIENNNNCILLQRSSINRLNDLDKCTIKDTKCENGIYAMSDRLNSIEIEAYKYINLKEKNQSIDCYSNSYKNVAYLNNEFPIESIKEGSLPFFLGVIILIIYTILYLCIFRKNG